MQRRAIKKVYGSMPDNPGAIGNRFAVFHDQSAETIAIRSPQTFRCWTLWRALTTSIPQ
jgi:hypothetical protein